ncbi:MAG TPA: GYF domain-containing protein [Steroidobacteraceae bacterium]|nr:GYF domain-containing protein [Steroidobacteraceae bacterium]
MSAHPRGAEGTAESRRWYLEVSARRAGPFAWAVLVELAQAGGLGADDRVWAMGIATWSRAADLPDLAPYIRAPAPSTRKLAASEPEEPVAARGQWGLPPLLLAAAIAWIAITVGFYAERLERWPSVLDGVLVARLDTAGPLLLLLAGLGVLPGIWRGTRPDRRGRNGALRGGIRTAAALSTLLLLTTAISTALNGHALWRAAIGADPVRPARIQLLPGGREVEIRGTLEAGVAARLASFLRSHPRVRVVHLNSPGGWVIEGERLARVIHARQLGTYTATGCYSACVLAFAAGRPRVLNPDARLGLHSTSGLDADADPAFARLGNRTYQKVLLRYGVSPALVAQSTSAPAGGLWMPDPHQLLAGHLIDRISAAGFSPSGESLAGLAPQAASFEARYPFLAELRRVDPSRFEQLDLAERLGVRRGATTTELNGYIAGAAAEIERDRLTAVDDSSALRFAASLRSAARPLQSSDPAQCVAILGPLSAASPVRSAAALAAIGPALVGILDAPTNSATTAPTIEVDVVQQVKEAVGQSFASAQPGAPEIDAKVACDRLLLMYDTAMTESVGTAAAFVRAMQGH